MSADGIQLSQASIDAIVSGVAELIKKSGGSILGLPVDSDPWFTREQASKYLNYSKRSFDRARKLHPVALKPVSESPIRWSRNALDVFKLTRGAPLHGRPGRRPRIAA